MRVDPRDEKWGWKWFFGAGLFAVALSCSLAYVDYSLINSDKEKRLGQTLRELRSAQTSLDSWKQDPRQLRIVTAAEADAEPVEDAPHH